MASQIVIFVDGSCSANPGGTASYGFVVYKDDVKIHDEFKVVGSGPDMSSNVAEFAGLGAALDYALGQGWKEVTIKADSALLVNQMNGSWRVRRGMYIGWYEAAKAKAAKFNKIDYVQIPREKNKAADELARKGWQ